MKKRLFVFVSTFPFGTKESFLENEVEFYNDFTDVWFFSLFSEGELRSMKFPDNIHWVPLKRYRKLELLLRFPLILFSSVFWREIINLIRHDKLSRFNVYELLVMIAQAAYFSHQTFLEIRNNNIDTSGENYLYSYWMSGEALTAINVSKKVKCKYLFTRVHRFDLYEERRKGNYIPCQDYISSKMDMIYPISTDGVDYLKKRIKCSNILVARLGTRDYGIEDIAKRNTEKLVLVSCSWCVEVKRIDLIIKALEEITDIRIEWTHFGDGPLLKALKEKAANLLSKNVECHFVGKRTNSEIIQFYKNNYVDIFINVSSSEGIPVSIMEAISFGIPVIATNVGGTSEIVQTGVNGYLLPSDFKTEQLVKRIRDFCKLSFQDMRILRQNARHFWGQNYSAATNYTNFFRLIVKSK